MAAKDSSAASRYYRKVIRIRGDDSPNVRYAQAQMVRGMSPTNEVLVPGVLTWHDYCKRRETWDAVRQCVGLDAEFYEGAEILLFPPEWLNAAESVELDRLCQSTPVEAIGIDPAEGGDKTSMAAVNRYGLKDLVSRKTPNTADVPNEAIAFMLRHQVRPERVMFDAGGGGNWAADQMRERGHPVTTVAFGESLIAELKRGLKPLEERKEERVDHYVYVNRRAEMYGTLSRFLDPSNVGQVVEGLPCAGFSIAPRFGAVLRHQLGPIPKTYDKEGRFYLLSKNRRMGEDENTKRPTLVELIGHSPDEADALVIAVHRMLKKTARRVAGVAGG